jgi:hypothetical protein
MKVTVEFTGAARALCGLKMIDVVLPETATYHDIVRLLAVKFPDLIGVLIDKDGETFLSANMFVINGDLATPAMVMSEQPHDGDHLMLMSLITGGSSRTTILPVPLKNDSTP